VEPMARVLGQLGAEHAWVVHGMGLDELTNTGPSSVAEWKDGQLRLFTVNCEEAGVQRGSLGELKGRDAHTNAQALLAALGGRRSAYHEAVILNAAAGFLVAGKAETLREGVALARASVSEGRARQALDRLVEITNAPAPAGA